MNTTRTAKQTLGLRHEPIAFSTVERARSYASACVVPLWTVTNGATVWLVCPRDAEKLHTQHGFAITR